MDAQERTVVVEGGLDGLERRLAHPGHRSEEDGGGVAGMEPDQARGDLDGVSCLGVACEVVPDRQAGAPLLDRDPPRHGLPDLPQAQLPACGAGAR